MIDHRKWREDDAERLLPEVAEEAHGETPEPSKTYGFSEAAGMSRRERPRRCHSVVEMAKIFNRSPRTVRDWIQKGRVKAFPIGRSQYITDAELARLLGEEDED